MGNRIVRAARTEGMFIICAFTVILVGALYILEWFGARQFEQDYKDSIAKVDSLNLQVYFINQCMNNLHVELIDGRLIISSEAKPSNVIVVNGAMK